jgi:3-deoxy-D-manno-octulosonate 8-phosphate phosphatase (KDO 8-P phosphatase)
MAITNNVQFKNITTFIFDIDGVLTDGTVLLLENGLQARTMNIKDGYALQLAVKKGYKVLAVSGADSALAAGRLNKLGITDVHLSVTDKKKFIAGFITANNLKKEEILYMGDDMPDLPAMSVVGLPTCPSDAVMEIKEAASYISSFSGGMGCVRDVIEKVLKLNNHWSHDADTASR